MNFLVVVEWTQLGYSKQICPIFALSDCEGSAVALMKRELTDTADAKWKLVYNTGRRALNVESKRDGSTERIGIDTALNLNGDGADQLRLAIVDLFKAAD